jgi:hypothetical protein
MTKPLLQITGEYPHHAVVRNFCTRELVFETHGPDAWSRAQAFYRANSKRWPGEAKDTARIHAIMPHKS